MKSVSEVCKIFGVTRKKLRYYEEIGLLIPTKDERNGYWYYSNFELRKLLFIQIFMEAGYKRKKIKEILDSPEFNTIKELEGVIKALEEKQNRIKGMISYVKAIKESTETRIQKLMENSDINALLSLAIFDVSTLLTSEMSVKDEWELNIDLLSRLTDSGRQACVELNSLKEELIDIGALKKDGNIQSKAVREHVSKFNCLCFEFIINVNGGGREEFNEFSNEQKSIIAATYGAFMAERFCSDERIIKSMELLYGPGAETFIMEAFMDYGEYISGDICDKSFREILEAYKNHQRIERNQNDGKVVRE